MTNVSKPLLYLDVDGVLNDHAMDELAGCCGIKPNCMSYLNLVIAETGCQIVLSSAWRYMVPDAMTLDGFWYMMRTHGMASNGGVNPFIGTTRRDIAPEDPRYLQVVDHWQNQPDGPVFCIVDDLDLGFSTCTVTANRFVQTNGKIGLDHRSAQEIIGTLRGDR